MLAISDRQFRIMASQAIDSLPQPYIDNMKNVAIVIEDDPTPEQKARLHLHNGQTLYGLYEGIPLTKRGNYTMALPDKITIFKNPIITNSQNLTQLKTQIKRTIWHEIAHHYGLNHQQINNLLNKKQPPSL
jgi:predicted Zn-dependent protease with MMP-like domain